MAFLKSKAGIVPNALHPWQTKMLVERKSLSKNLSKRKTNNLIRTKVKITGESNLNFNPDFFVIKIKFYAWH